MYISEQDKDILKKLGSCLADISSLSCQKKKVECWKSVNDLKSKRPVLWINEIPWHEMNIDGELDLKTESQWAREVETNLRRLIYQWKHMPGDMIVSDYIASPLVLNNTGFGISEDSDKIKTDESSHISSSHFKPQFLDETDAAKIKFPEISLNQIETEEIYDNLTRVFRDILPVRKVGLKFMWFTPWDFLIKYWGVQEALMDLVIRPDMVNTIVSRYVDAWICQLEQWQRINALGCNNDNTRIGSGGYGYTDQLPGQDYNPEYVKPQNMWGCSNAQIFSEVSPDMHWEFALRHEVRWLERWGLTYYGCCEPLHNKIGLMRKIPNLRKISISPWADIDKTVSEVKDDYVISYKPNPAIFAEDVWDIKRAEAELKSVLDKTIDCHIEIIMKDISTLRYHPQRLWEWEKMATNLICNYYKS